MKQNSLKVVILVLLAAALLCDNCVLGARATRRATLLSHAKKSATKAKGDYVLVEAPKGDCAGVQSSGTTDQKESADTTQEEVTVTAEESALNQMADSTDMGSNFNEHGETQITPKHDLIKPGTEVGQYVLMKLVGDNDESQRWLAKHAYQNTMVIMKFYIKKSGDDYAFWTVEDRYPAPKQECDQLNHLVGIQEQTFEDVNFEKCLSTHKFMTEAQTDGDKTPIYNLYQRSVGESLYQLCVVHNCRGMIRPIATGLLHLLSVMNSDKSVVYFKHGALGLNSVYYDLKDQIISVADYQFSQFLSDTPAFRDDMRSIGLILTDMMLQGAQIEGTPRTSLEFFRLVHALPEFESRDDTDIGVDSNIRSGPNQNEFKADKQEKLRKSLYDFIIKCLGSETTEPFESIQEALEHPFINVSIEGPPYKKSDY